MREKQIEQKPVKAVRASGGLCPEIISFTILRFRAPLYRAFCVRTNDYCRSTTEFYSALEQRGFDRHRTREVRYVRGLRLLDEQL